MSKKIPARPKKRLLIITPFEKTIRRVTEETATIRNKMMIENADEIVLGYISKGGQLEKMYSDFKNKKKFTIL